MDTPVVRLEQTTASVIGFLLAAAQDATDVPVTAFVQRSVPDNWTTPSAHFPVPELSRAPQTLHDFVRVHTMYTIWFGRTLAEAQRMADAADIAIHAARDSIPLLNADGTTDSRHRVRMRPDMQAVRVSDPDAAAVQLAVTWEKPIRYDEPDRAQWVNLNVDMFRKNRNGEHARY